MSPVGLLGVQEERLVEAADLAQCLGAEHRTEPITQLLRARSLPRPTASSHALHGVGNGHSTRAGFPSGRPARARPREAGRRSAGARCRCATASEDDLSHPGSGEARPPRGRVDRASAKFTPRRSRGWCRRRGSATLSSAHMLRDVRRTRSRSTMVTWSRSEGPERMRAADRGHPDATTTTSDGSGGQGPPTGRGALPRTSGGTARPPASHEHPRPAPCPAAPGSLSHGASVLRRTSALAQGDGSSECTKRPPPTDDLGERPGPAGGHRVPAGLRLDGYSSELLDPPRVGREVRQACRARRRSAVAVLVSVFEEVELRPVIITSVSRSAGARDSEAGIRRSSLRRIVISSDGHENTETAPRSGTDG